jgi:hypothetical protein
VFLLPKRVKRVFRSQNPSHAAPERRRKSRIALGFLSIVGGVEFWNFDRVERGVIHRRYGFSGKTRMNLIRAQGANGAKMPSGRRRLC